MVVFTDRARSLPCRSARVDGPDIGASRALQVDQRRLIAQQILPAVIVKRVRWYCCGRPACSSASDRDAWPRDAHGGCARLCPAGSRA